MIQRVFYLNLVNGVWHGTEDTWSKTLPEKYHFKSFHYLAGREAHYCLVSDFEALTRETAIAWATAIHTGAYKTTVINLEEIQPYHRKKRKVDPRLF